MFFNLYSLRQSPLLSSLYQNLDDITKYRIDFLRVGSSDGIKMFNPTLYECNRNSLFHPVTRETFSLQSDSVLFLDYYIEAIIWIGSNIVLKKDDEFTKYILEYSLEQIKNRNPPCILYKVKENSSLSRKLTCRLIPGHKDPEVVYKERYPPEMHPILKELKLKLIPTHELSFWEYKTAMNKLVKK